MERVVSVGAVSGGLLAAVSIAGNVQRGDLHVVSTLPDVLPLVLLPLLVFNMTRRKVRAGATSNDAVSYGVRVSLIAAAVFAVGVSSFSLAWLPTRSLHVAAFGFATAFVLTSGLGFAAARLGSRRGSPAV